MPLTSLFRRRLRSLPRDIEDEIAALCTSRQFEQLALSPHMRSDLGLDCGCNDAPPAPARFV